MERNAWCNYAESNMILGSYVAEREKESAANNEQRGSARERSERASRGIIMLHSYTKGGAWGERC